VSWMQEFLSSTIELESPQSYFYWSLLTTISAVVKNKIWIDRGGVYKLYPNIYTFILSKQSGLGKNAPVMVAKKLAHDLGIIRVIDGQNSIQGVIKELGKVVTLKSGHIIKNAEGFLLTGEFASFMIQDGVGFSLTTLTDMYDTHSHEDTGYTKRLASQDEVKLKNLCLTALFASNETHFFETVPKHAISGGFLARTFCVYEEKRNTLNSLTGHQKPNPKPIAYGDILNQLHQLAKLEGVMSIENEALHIYDEWYYDFYARDLEQDDDTGTYARLKDNIWKAATLIGLANNADLLITKEDMEEAVFRCSETFSGLKRLLLGGTKDNKNIKSITMRTVVASMIERPPDYEIGRKVILRKGAGVFGVYDLDETVEHLLQAGMIRTEKRGGEVYYKLSKLMITKHLEINKNGTGEK